MAKSLADAWDEGYDAGDRDARAVNAAWPEPTRNPYRVRPSLAETVARWQARSDTDPTWRADYRDRRTDG